MTSALRDVVRLLNVASCALRSASLISCEALKVARAAIQQSLTPAEISNEGPATSWERIGADCFGAPQSVSRWDDFSRQVYCVLGIPVDAIDMSGLLCTVECAAASGTPFVISTPNLNYLANSQRNAKFRETLFESELCPADGMPIIWIARLLHLPIKQRVAGSDMFEELSAPYSTRRLNLFLFGGTKGAAEAAARSLNESPGELHCVGFLYPGFGTIEELSQAHIIDEINASHADFLLVALGAEKGQLWLQHNRRKLQIPLRAHLGAVLNFAAKKCRRAPFIARKLGLEWLWRIKQEPYLWPRYWNDGITLLGLLLTRGLPLAIWTRWEQLTARGQRKLVVHLTEDAESVTLNLSGAAIEGNIDEAIACFRHAAAAKKTICVSFSHTCMIDARFLGLLLMLRKQVKEQNSRLTLIGLSYRLRTAFRLNGLGFLLASEAQ